ncbi:MAG: hypothetical protein QF582_18750, partial [Alphaproteobacteria bacterium]|nr:hypothetical protein [Alphaproteobacteria bacterium]
MRHRPQHEILSRTGLQAAVSRPHDNGDHLHDVTELLGIGEFRLFQLARQRQTGRQVPERELESPFMAYLRTGEPPAWVR